MQVLCVFGPALGRWLLLLVFSCLTACGGGGSTDPAQPVADGASAAMSQARAVHGPSLILDAPILEGHGTLRAVGALADGGYMVAWSQRDTVGNANAWTGVQRRDASWSPVGGPVTIPRPVGPGSILIRPNGELLIVYFGGESTSYPAPVRLTVEVARFASDGTPIGAPIVAFRTELSRQPPSHSSFGELRLAQWSSGEWIVGWLETQNATSGHSVAVYTRRFASNGQPIGPVRVDFTLLGSGPQNDLAGNLGAFRLTTIEPDAYLAAIPQLLPGLPAGRIDLGFLSVGLERPLDLPVAPVRQADWVTGPPVGSWVLPLRNGEAVLFSGDRGATVNDPLVDPYAQHFNRAGHAPPGQRDPIGSIPFTAVALEDGGYVVVRAGPAGEPLAERYDSHGKLLGEAVALPAFAMAATLVNGDVILAYNDAAGDVYTQRLRLPLPRTPPH